MNKIVVSCSALNFRCVCALLLSQLLVSVSCMCVLCVCGGGGGVISDLDCMVAFTGEVFH